MTIPTCGTNITFSCRVHDVNINNFPLVLHIILIILFFFAFFTFDTQCDAHSFEKKPYC